MIEKNKKKHLEDNWLKLQRQALEKALARINREASERAELRSTVVEKDIKKLIEQYPGHKGFSFFYQKCTCEIGECTYVN